MKRENMYCEKCGVKTLDGMNICEQCEFAAEWRKKSGIDKYAQKAIPVPQEIRFFNPGAFLLGWIWALAHRLWALGLMYLFVFVVFPNLLRIALEHDKIDIMAYIAINIALFIAQIAFSIYLGITGNEKAWKARPRDNVQKFLKAQRNWAVVGIAHVALIIVSLLV